MKIFILFILLIFLCFTENTLQAQTSGSAPFAFFKKNPSGSGFDPGGVSVGGYCWYWGAEPESCDSVCSTHGGYNLATDTYAGYNGTDANCIAVLDALGVPGTGLDGYCPMVNWNHGCQWASGGVNRSRCAVLPTVSDWGQGLSRRACACNN